MPTKTVNYGTAQEPNLKEISKALAGHGSPLYDCNVHFREHGVSFRGKPTLTLTPEKPNTARAVIDVFYGKKKVGDFYVILFAPGDGTGDGNTYKMDAVNMSLAYGVEDNSPLHIPREYRQWGSQPERILPRNKLGKKVLTELFLPLASFEEKKYHQGIVSLEQLTVRQTEKGQELVKDFVLGENVKLYQGNVSADSSYHLSFPGCQQLTCGYYRNGQRFGDPHAVYFNPAVAQGRLNLLQVAGFLSVDDKDNPLCKVLDKVGRVPEKEVKS